jgi:3-hydroxyisobutyrate dehydrogenase-like beta-hydroxyacid dehydrogenase
MTDVGFIGIGAMGRPMSANLAKAGHRVIAWNRSVITPPDGVTLVESARAVAAQTDVAFVMVSDRTAVEEVLFGKGGWIEGARPGAVIIQSSTIGPTATELIAARVAAAGFGFLDAPVSGSVKPAETAQLTILGGGDQAVFGRYQSLFDAIAAKTVVFGGIGSGSAAKLVVNGLLVSVIAAAAEGLSWLAARAPEVDVATVASAFERISPLAATRAGAIAGDAPTGGFSLRQAAKDMELVCTEFGDAAVMEAVRALSRKGLDMGLKDRDVACLGAVVRDR